MLCVLVFFDVSSVICVRLFFLRMNLFSFVCCFHAKSDLRLVYDCGRSRFSCFYSNMPEKRQQESCLFTEEKEHSHHIETWSKAVSLMKLECFFSQRCPFYVAFYCFLFCHLIPSVQHTSLMERARKKSISFFRCDCNLRTFWIVRLPCNLALLNWLWTSTSIDAVAAREKKQRKLKQKQE